ncbi:unnamed protein product [Penicillium salamii]|nr:unnamed protein product [Penicillium salamii]CAG8326747.1 unnamed protein product [Penicillium salamii]
MDPSRSILTEDASVFKPPTAKLEASNNRQLPAFRHDEPSYQESSRYLQYRAEPRGDTDEDGMPLWSDEIEDAFRLALLAMESKKHQLWMKEGVKYGRDEFIANHIGWLTGKRRTREQVNSHIKHLHSLLNGEPDCKLKWSRASATKRELQ